MCTFLFFFLWNCCSLFKMFTVWKVSKYGVFSGPYSVPMQEIRTKKKLRIWTLFTQWLALKALTLLLLDGDDNQKTSSKEAWKHCLRPWLGKRQRFGCYYLLFQEIKRDTKAFKELIRIEESQFQYLVEALTQKILKKDAKWENASNYMKWSA